MQSSRLGFCLVFVFQATPAENVWSPRSKSARSQVFAALFYVRTVTFVRAWISPASNGSMMLSQSKHRSGVCRASSTAPAECQRRKLLPFVQRCARSGWPSWLSFITLVIQAHASWLSEKLKLDKNLTYVPHACGPRLSR